MLAVRLVQMIEDHAEELTRELVKESAEPTPNSPLPRFNL